MSWPFPNVPDPATKFPNDLWAGDQLNLDGLEQGDGLLLQEEFRDSFLEYQAVGKTIGEFRGNGKRNENASIKYW